MSLSRVTHMHNLLQKRKMKNKIKDCIPIGRNPQRKALLYEFQAFHLRNLEESEMRWMTKWETSPQIHNLPVSALLWTKSTENTVFIISPSSSSSPSSSKIIMIGIPWFIDGFAEVHSVWRKTCHIFFKWWVRPVQNESLKIAMLRKDSFTETLLTPETLIFHLT